MIISSNQFSLYLCIESWSIEASSKQLFAMTCRENWTKWDSEHSAADDWWNDRHHTTCDRISTCICCSSPMLHHPRKRWLWANSNSRRFLNIPIDISSPPADAFGWELIQYTSMDRLLNIPIRTNEIVSNRAEKSNHTNTNRTFEIICHGMGISGRDNETVERVSQRRCIGTHRVN